MSSANTSRSRTYQPSARSPPQSPPQSRRGIRPSSRPVGKPVGQSKTSKSSRYNYYRFQNQKEWQSALSDAWHQLEDQPSGDRTSSKVFTAALEEYQAVGGRLRKSAPPRGWQGILEHLEAEILPLSARVSKDLHPAVVVLKDFGHEISKLTNHSPPNLTQVLTHFGKLEGFLLPEEATAPEELAGAIGAAGAAEVVALPEEAAIVAEAVALPEEVALVGAVIVAL